MLAILRTAAIFGVEAYPVRVEVDVSDGELPAITMVGLPDASVRESRDRVQSAIRNSGFEFPRRHVTVNLSPADIRKVGSAFDLPIALGVLAATGLIPIRQIDDAVILGELSLDGPVQPVRGALPVSALARRDCGTRGRRDHLARGDRGRLDRASAQTDRPQAATRGRSLSSRRSCRCITSGSTRTSCRLAVSRWPSGCSSIGHESIFARDAVPVKRFAGFRFAASILEAVLRTGVYCGYHPTGTRLRFLR